MSEFHKKHIGPSQREIDEMLQYLGCSSLNDLLEKIVPKNILDIDDMSVGNEVFSENDILNHVKKIGRNNKVLSLIHI